MIVVRREADKDFVCWPIAPLPPGPPGPRERMVRTAPQALARASAPVFRLSAGNRLRRRALTEMVQIGFAMYERREYEAMTGFYSEDLVYDLSGFGERRPPDLDVEYHGHAGMVEVLRGLQDLSVSFVPSEVADAGGSVFAARVDYRLHGDGPSSGLEVALDVGHVYLVRGGVCVRHHSYIGWDEALTALGEARAGHPPWGG